MIYEWGWLLDEAFGSVELWIFFFNCKNLAKGLKFKQNFVKKTQQFHANPLLKPLPDSIGMSKGCGWVSIPIQTNKTNLIKSI